MTISRAAFPRNLALVVIGIGVWLSAGCGGDAGSSMVTVAPPPAPVDLMITGHAVTKARAGNHTVAFLQEHLVSIFEQGPQRALEILDSTGTTPHEYAAPDGWSVVDF